MEGKWNMWVVGASWSEWKGNVIVGSEIVLVEGK